jgi:CTP synthase (UTP-ammonia lyase)
MPPLRIGLIGDYNPANATHLATDAALQHTARGLSLSLESVWLPTETLDGGPDCAARLGSFDGLWCAPASPYRSMDGALAGIRFARERGRPFIGT